MFCLMFCFYNTKVILNESITFSPVFSFTVLYNFNKLAGSLPADPSLSHAVNELFD